MDVFNEELLKFWRALQQNDVLYIMVGGVATNLHGIIEPQMMLTCGLRILWKTGKVYEKHSENMAWEILNH